MSIVLLVNLSSRPSAQVSFSRRPASGASPQRRPPNRHGRQTQGVHHISQSTSDAPSPDGSSPHTCDRRRGITHTESSLRSKHIPVCNIHSSLLAAGGDRAFRATPSTNSLINLLRKRYRKGKTAEKPAPKSSSVLYASVTGLPLQKAKRLHSFSSFRQGYEPLSRRKHRERKMDDDDSVRKTSLTFWE